MSMGILSFDMNGRIWKVEYC